MPNYCENTLRIIPLTDAARALLPEIAGRFIPGNQFPELSAFQLIHPMPSELQGTKAPGDTPNWYDWRVENWGTKWEECEPTIGRYKDEELLVYFQTAWAPPIGIYQRLVELGFDVLATYAEQGMGFAGYWENGLDIDVPLSEALVPADDGDFPDDGEILAKAFARTGLVEELLPPGLGG